MGIILQVGNEIKNTKKLMKRLSQAVRFKIDKMIEALQLERNQVKRQNFDKEI